MHNGIICIMGNPTVGYIFLDYRISAKQNSFYGFDMWNHNFDGANNHMVQSWK